MPTSQDATTVSLTSTLLIHEMMIGYTNVSEEDADGQTLFTHSILSWLLRGSRTLVASNP